MPGPVPATRVARHLVDRSAERLQQAAHRHVLAERHAPHLLVAAADRAVGQHDDLRVDERVPADRVFGDADDDRGAEPLRLGRDLGRARRSSRRWRRRSRSRATRRGRDRAPAFEWRRGGARRRHAALVLLARVPCGPPPCTKATSMLRPVGVPSGATTATARSTTTGPMAKAGRQSRRSQSIDNPTPTMRVAHVKSRGPPIRASRSERTRHLTDGEAGQRRRRRTGRRTGSPRRR